VSSPIYPAPNIPLVGLNSKDVSRAETLGRGEEIPSEAFLCAPAREQILISYWGRLGRRWPAHADKKGVSLYSLGAKYSIDGPWILAVKVLNWLGLGEKDAVVRGNRADGRDAFLVNIE